MNPLEWLRRVAASEPGDVFPEDDDLMGVADAVQGRGLCTGPVGPCAQPLGHDGPCDDDGPIPYTPTGIADAPEPVFRECLQFLLWEREYNLWVFQGMPE